MIVGATRENSGAGQGHRGARASPGLRDDRQQLVRPGLAVCAGQRGAGGGVRVDAGRAPPVGRPPARPRGRGAGQAEHRRARDGDRGRDRACSRRTRPARRPSATPARGCARRGATGSGWRSSPAADAGGTRLTPLVPGAAPARRRTLAPSSRGRRPAPPPKEPRRAGRCRPAAPGAADDVGNVPPPPGHAGRARGPAAVSALAHARRPEGDDPARPRLGHGRHDPHDAQRRRRGSLSGTRSRSSACGGRASSRSSRSRPVSSSRWPTIAGGEPAGAWPGCCGACPERCSSPVIARPGG